MLHFLVGLRSQYTRFCEELICAAMGSEEVERGAVIRADSARDLAIGLLRRHGRPTLAVLNEPPASLYSAMCDSGRKIVVAYDDPIRCIFELVQTDGYDIAGAVRSVASGMANLPLYMSLPNALAVRPPLEESSHVEIANHLGLTPARKTWRTPLPNLSGDANSWRRSLSKEANGMIVGALQPLWDHEAAAVFRWPASLFWQGDKSIGGPIDITGRARCLFEGPGITLPSGAWRLSLRLDFSETATDSAIRIEVSAGTICGIRDVIPERAGKVEVDFDFSVDQNTTGPLLVRASLLRAAFDGTITLGHVCVGRRYQDT